MSRTEVIQAIRQGDTALGIEFGSTRIKAVLVDGGNRPIASGDHAWENRLQDGVWTYTMEDIWGGIQKCYAAMKQEVKETYGETLATVGAIGISGMMHGYLPFDGAGELLVPFRTWRNTMTAQASRELSKLFSFHIPQRWSIAHLYQAILNGEEHVGRIRFLTTLAGYVHWKLTGEKVAGIGEAAGIFPIDSARKTYDAAMMEQFQNQIAGYGCPWKLEEILPRILLAGEEAGRLTAAGAKLLDVDGDLRSGILFCPPEGDAGTGMTATNSVRICTGNVSAGTSVFAMAVLEKPLSQPYEEIDMVTTPTGHPVAMVHCNNCTSDLNAWVGLFGECLQAFGLLVDVDTLYGTLYGKALEGDADGGGLLAYNYYSGEHITGFEEGRPLFVRRPDDAFDLANFMRTQLFTALGALKTGMDILIQKEGVRLERMFGHGGLFKTAGVGQKIMAAAIHTPVSLMETAGEGGAWGIALLASYMKNKAAGETLEDYLDQAVFCGNEGSSIEPDPKDEEGFAAFMERYHAGLSIERAAVDALK